VELDFPPAAVRRFVEQRFSLERMVDQYAALYAEILGSARQELSVA
jgi:hypothetical protein